MDLGCVICNICVKGERVDKRVKIKKGDSAGQLDDIETILQKIGNEEFGQNVEIKIHDGELSQGSWLLIDGAFFFHRLDCVTSLTISDVMEAPFLYTSLATVLQSNPCPLRRLHLHLDLNEKFCETVNIQTTTGSISLVKRSSRYAKAIEGSSSYFALAVGENHSLTTLYLDYACDFPHTFCATLLLAVKDRPVPFLSLSLPEISDFDATTWDALICALEGNIYAQRIELRHGSRQPPGDLEHYAKWLSNPVDANSEYHKKKKLLSKALRANVVIERVTGNVWNEGSIPRNMNILTAAALLFKHCRVILLGLYERNGALSGHFTASIWRHGSYQTGLCVADELARTLWHDDLRARNIDVAFLSSEICTRIVEAAFKRYPLFTLGTGSEAKWALKRVYAPH